MHAELNGTYRRPIVLNETTLSRLAALLDEVRSSRFRSLAVDEKVSLQDLESIWRRERVIAVPEKPPPLDASLKAVDEYYEAVRLKEQFRRKAEELDELCRVRISVQYKTGSSYEVNELGQLADILGDEPGIVERISILHGAFHKDLLTMHLRDGFATCQYSVRAERGAAENVRSSTQRFLTNSLPDHAYLHHKALHGILAIVLANVLGYYVSSRWFGPALGSTPKLQSWPAMLVSAMTGGLTVLIVTRLMERVFPKLQVEFGPHWRQLKARRALLFLVLTALLLPILLDLLKMAL